MTAPDTRAALLAVLRRIAPEIRPDRIDGTKDLREQVDLDSVDYLDFLIGVSRATGVTIPERDYAKVNSLDALVAYVEARRPPAAA